MDPTEATIPGEAALTGFRQQRLVWVLFGSGLTPGVSRIYYLSSQLLNDFHP